MFLLFTYKTKRWVVGPLSIQDTFLGDEFVKLSQSCAGSSYLNLVKVQSWFGLFYFLDIFPYSTKYYVLCPESQEGFRVRNEELDGFLRVAEKNMQTLKQGGKIEKLPVTQQADGTKNDAETQHILKELSKPQAVNDVKKEFEKINKPDHPYSFPPFGMRILTGVIDLALVILIFVIVWFGTGIDGTYALQALIGVFFVYFVGCELSPWQGTIGKKMFGQLVVTENLEKISPLQALFRYVLYSPTIYFTFLSPINLISMIVSPRNRTIHDIVTKTMVIHTTRDLQKADLKTNPVTMKTTEKGDTTLPKEILPGIAWTFNQTKYTSKEKFNEEIKAMNNKTWKPDQVVYPKREIRVSLEIPWENPPNDLFQFTFESNNLENFTALDLMYQLTNAVARHDLGDKRYFEGLWYDEQNNKYWVDLGS
jgi:uncharacterized RDD family membrane protein YckC